MILVRQLEGVSDVRNHGVGFVIAVLLCIRYYFKRKTAEPVRPYNCLTIT